MKQLSVSLVLLSVLVISACTITPPPPGSLAEIRQQARKVVQSECLHALWLSKGRKITYYAVSGGMVDVFGYCAAYARSRVETSVRLPDGS